MKSITFHLAWRYLTCGNDNASIRVMMRLCFAGIAIGSCALMLSLIIMHGFEAVISEKMRGINAPITISSPGNHLDEDSIHHAVTQVLGSACTGTSPSSTKQVIITHGDQQTVVILRGINPAAEGTVTSLADKILAPATAHPDARSPQAGRGAALTHALAPGKLLLGYKLARMLRLGAGATCTIQVPEPRSKKHIKLVNRTVTVGGVFKVGLEEYDANMAFVDLATLNSWFDEQGAEQIAVGLALQDEAAQATYLQRLQKRLPHLTIVSWQEQYPALVASLKLEKYVMFLILALVTLVACMNMISLLFMQIQHKRRDIALLKTLGMGAGQLWLLFMWMGMVITTSASLTGLAIAGAIGYCLQHGWRISLPDVYFIDYVPASLEWQLFVVVFAATLLLGLVATWLPLRNLKGIAIVDILRNG